MTADLTAAATVSKPTRYHPALVALHWLTFILIFATFFLRGGEVEAKAEEARSFQIFLTLACT